MENLIEVIRTGSMSDSVDAVINVLNGTGWLYKIPSRWACDSPSSSIKTALSDTSLSEKVANICIKIFRIVIEEPFPITLTSGGEKSLFVCLRNQYYSSEVTQSLASVCDIIALKVSQPAIFRDDPDQHSRLLQILVAGKSIQTEQFWLGQNDLLGSSYAAVTFSGMFLHGNKIAINNFSQFFRAEDSVRNLMPTLICIWANKGFDCVMEFLSDVIPNCTAEVRQKLEHIQKEMESLR